MSAGSSEAEILFSGMKRVKSSLRNCLKTTKLDHLMRVSVEGPPIGKWEYRTQSHDKEIERNEE